MQLRMFQVDAFADRLFEGNPAAVCPLERWPDERLLQAIARENNLSETTFFVPTPRGWHLRWFTPTREVDLCGHATLASAFVLFNDLKAKGTTLLFESLSGDLTVTREGDLLVLDFPRRPPLPCDLPPLLAEALGARPETVLRADDYIAVFASADEVKDLHPDFRRLAELECRGVIATAPASEYDFVCRFFAPRYGIDEDPVTGSAYTELAPYWKARLGRPAMVARQVSARGGTVSCTDTGSRVRIGGRAVKFMEAWIAIPDCF